MNNLVMCFNTTCNKRSLCLRYTAEPKDIMQGYMIPQASSCNNFIENDRALPTLELNKIDSRNNKQSAEYYGE
jgi:hypothetical protein